MAANGCFTPTSIDAGADGETATVADRLGGEDRDLRRAEARLTVEPLFRELPARDRRIVELRFFRGYTQDQDRQGHRRDPDAVSRLLTRILANFRTQLRLIRRNSSARLPPGLRRRCPGNHIPVRRSTMSTDAIVLLKADHKEIREQFREFADGRARTPRPRRARSSTRSSSC